MHLLQPIARNLILAGSILISQIWINSFAKATERSTIYTLFTIDQSQCNSLQVKSGTVIYIPENAFSTSDGQTYRGKIAIKYCEFRNQADILWAGISMRYDNTYLVSAGMFELVAEGNGQLLILTPGKEIKVAYAGTKTTQKTEAYFYNRQNKKWIPTQRNIVERAAMMTNEDQSKLWGSGLVPVANTSMQNDDVTPMDSATIALYRRQDSLRLVVYREMNIDRLGIHNYDYKLSETEMISFTANFINTSTGKKPEKVFVVYEGLNTVIYYYPTEYESFFKLLPRKDIRIFSLDSLDKIAIYPPENLRNMDLASLQYKKFTIELTPRPMPVKSPDAIIKTLNLKP